MTVGKVTFNLRNSEMINTCSELFIIPFLKCYFSHSWSLLHFWQSKKVKSVSCFACNLDIFFLQCNLTATKVQHCEILWKKRKRKKCACWVIPPQRFSPHISQTNTYKQITRQFCIKVQQVFLFFYSLLMQYFTTDFRTLFWLLPSHLTLFNL